MSGNETRVALVLCVLERTDWKFMTAKPAIQGVSLAPVAALRCFCDCVSITCQGDETAFGCEQAEAQKLMVQADAAGEQQPALPCPTATWSPQAPPCQAACTHTPLCLQDVLP